MEQRGIHKNAMRYRARVNLFFYCQEKGSSEPHCMFLRGSSWARAQTLEKCADSLVWVGPGVF
jgi:hypothetical protein